MASRLPLVDAPRQVMMLDETARDAVDDLALPVGGAAPVGVEAAAVASDLGSAIEQVAAEQPGERPDRESVETAWLLLASTRRFLDHVDRLDTEHPANVPLYTHFGYRVVGQEQLGPVTIWSMFRPNGIAGGEGAER